MGQANAFSGVRIMRPFGVALGLFFVTGSFVIAQIPGGAPPAGTPTGRVPTPGAGQGTVLPSGGQLPAAPDPQVVAYLKAWEQVTAGLQTFYTKCDLKREDRVLKKSKSYTGSVVCMKPNFARMRIELVGDPVDYTAYLCDGKAVFEYDGSKKVRTQYNIPAGAAGVGDNLLMEFMAGTLKADEAVRRFDVKILTPAKPDENYIYFEIKPRLPKDKQEFETLKLVLYSPNIRKDHQYLAYLPAMVEISSTNAERVETWTFKDPLPNAKGIALKDFQAIDPGKDWQKVIGNPPAPGQPQPRVVRPTSPGK